MKAAHIKKIRERAEQFQRMLGVDPEASEESRRLWTGRMASAISSVLGHDQSGATASSQRARRAERRAMADGLWVLIARDLTEMCDALLEANREVQRLRTVLHRAGIDDVGELLPEKPEAVKVIERSLLPQDAASGRRRGLEESIRDSHCSSEDEPVAIATLPSGAVIEVW